MKTVYLVLFIFISSLLVYGIIPFNSLSQAKQEAEVHRHANITIEGVDIQSLKHAEDFSIHHPIHLHREDVVPTLHMEGVPIPLSAFFKSIQFSTFGYDVYVNGKLKDFNYIFEDGDEIKIV